MADDFRIDADPSIPTGVDATSTQVAEHVLSGKMPADAIPRIAEEQRPTQEDVDIVIARRPDLAIGGVAKIARLGALKKVIRSKSQG